MLEKRAEETAVFSRRIPEAPRSCRPFTCSCNEDARVSETSLTQTIPFQIADYLVEPARLRVTNDAAEARLEAKVMLVLLYLAEHAGDVVSRAELEEQLWPGRIVTEDSVTKAIAKLRRVFEDDARHPRVIETVPKSGYRLIAEVTRINEAIKEDAATSMQTATVKQWSWRLSLPWALGSGFILVLLIGAMVLLERDRSPSVSSVPFSNKPAVAVVPFENHGIAPEEDYFTNGITADLITDLSKVNGLLVIAPGTVFAYQNSERKPGGKPDHDQENHAQALCEDSRPDAGAQFIR
jgi:DNA-binding winged helix-turn-helix (wHTH) protein